MRYEDEIREAQRYFEDVGAEATTGEQLELAERLIASKTATFDPGKFKDHYQAALRELVAAKLRGRLASKETAEPVGGAKIISLMDALKRSLKTDEARKPGRSPSRDGKSPAKRRHAAATRRRRNRRSRGERTTVACGRRPSPGPRREPAKTMEFSEFTIY